jgi:hypothetical protein
VLKTLGNWKKAIKGAYHKTDRNLVGKICRQFGPPAGHVVRVQSIANQNVTHGELVRVDVNLPVRHVRPSPKVRPVRRVRSCHLRYVRICRCSLQKCTTCIYGAYRSDRCWLPPLAPLAARPWQIDWCYLHRGRTAWRRRRRDCTCWFQGARTVTTGVPARRSPDRRVPRLAWSGRSLPGSSRVSARSGDDARAVLMQRRRRGASPTHVHKSRARDPWPGGYRSPHITSKSSTT